MGKLCEQLSHVNIFLDIQFHIDKNKHLKQDHLRWAWLF